MNLRFYIYLILYGYKTIIKPEHYNCDKYCVKIKNNFYSIQLVVGQGSYVRIEKIEDNKGYELITYENIK